MKEQFDILSAPLLPDQVEWRVGNQTKDGQKLVVLAYIDNRAVMKRLDEAFGPMGWQSSFKEVSDGILCTISIKDEQGNWIGKSDAASRRDVEPLKSAISDSMKRAAVQWQIGRELYNYPRVMVETTSKFLPDWSKALLDSLVTKINSGATVPDVIVLKESHAKR